MSTQILQGASMIVGDPSTFAIESEIHLAFERQNQMALGFFVVHLMGRCYGIREPNATMLADPFHEVGRRIAGRGSHKPSFPMDTSADAIAYSFRRAIYSECQEGELFFGVSAREFAHPISSNRLEWSGYYEEAFDDSSYVLHFEDRNQVRLIAFIGTADFLYDQTSLRELCVSQDRFYEILQEWHERFGEEWKSCPKASDSVQ